MRTLRTERSAVQRALAVVLASALSGAACSSEAPAPTSCAAETVSNPNVFVGKTEGGEALVAFVHDGTTVMAYSCGVGAGFGTHTGWYGGVATGETATAIEAVNGTQGLALRAEITGSAARGSITIADGRSFAFTAEQARGAAGLFEFEDAGNLVGLIRTNQGEVAGNAVVRVGSTGTAPSSPTSTPVTTTSSGSSPTPSLPVTFDNGGSNRNVSVVPVTTPAKRLVTRSGPVVVFLLHGMADNIGQKPTGAAEDFVECAGPKDTPFYARCEWGQDFLPGLFGSRSSQVVLSTLDGRDVTGDRFLTTPENRQPFDENLGRRMNGDCVADPNEAERFDARTAMHFVVPGTVAQPIRQLPSQIVVPPTPPPIAAFTTWRDPTRSMAFSGRRVTRQIYAALRWYEETYRVTPGVVLLAQSFGGLASRFMLSKPDASVLTAEMNRENVRLCAEDLAKMDYVRDRTLYLLTLATPHEGSYLSEWGPLGKNTIRAILTDLRQGLATASLSTVARRVNDLATVLQLNYTPSILDQAVSGLDGFIPQLENAPALLDMRLALMEKFNLGPISPERARRSASSPILGAGKTLVPIYATLARSPGSDAFDSPDLLGGFAAWKAKRAKARGWINSTMLFSDPITRLTMPKGFGDATAAPYAQYRDILDRRARLFDASPSTEAMERALAPQLAAALEAASPWIAGRYGRTAAGVLRALNREGSLQLPNVSVPIHIDQKWSVGFRGFLEVPMPALQCGTRTIRLDYDALARLLVNTYVSTPAVFTATRGRNLVQVLQGVGTVLQETDLFAKGVASWFVGKVRELANVQALPAECNALPDSVFDVFAMAEIGNWRIVETTGLVPAPAWIPTGEPVSDGEMDTDGAVHSASALGFTLARRPFYFEHDRNDDGGAPGSWYRLYDNPVTEKFNHGLQYENEVGRWVRDSFLAAGVGPIPSRTGFSGWSR